MSEPEAAEPAVGTVVAHRWRLVERVALEGDTLVFRADDLKGGKPALLKLLDARCAASRELAARFDRDARTISRLNHANCVQILDFGIFEARPYLVMQAVAGRRLGDELGKPQLTPTRATRIATQILEGLRHGHAYGVVHRELGPDKIWLTGAANGPDHVKILDFGLARISGDDKKRTAANAFGCLAPEQLQQRTVDQRADLFAVGVLLRAMASGQSLPAVDGAAGRPLTPALQRVVARALAKDPEQRFADAGELIDELEAIGEGRTAKRRKIDVAPPPRLGRALALALAALVVAGGGVGWWLRARRTRSAPATVTAAQPAANEPVAAKPIAENVPPPSPPIAKPAPVAPVVTPPVTTKLAPTAAAATKSTTTAPTNAAAAKVPPTTSVPAKTTSVPAKAATTASAETKTAPSSPAPTPAAAAKPANVVAGAAPATKAAVVPASAPPAPKATATATAPTAATNEPAPAGESARVTALLTAGKLDVAEQELRAQLDLHAESAELHFLLGEVFFRKFWRRDALVEWDRALALDPSLRRDPRLTARLCATLSPRFHGAGAELIAKRFAAEAVPLLRGCVASATDLERLQTAAQLAEQLGGKNAIDPQLVTRRTQELTPKAAPSP